MEWYPFYPSLYRQDTMHLTPHEDGCYRRLIDEYMITRAPLTDNDVALARIIGISVNDFQAIAEQMRGFFSANAGLLHSKRCDIELDRQDNISKKRSEVAKNGAAKRLKKPKASKQLPSNSTDTGQDKTRQKEKERTLTGSKENDDLLALDQFARNPKPAATFEEWGKQVIRKTGKMGVKKQYLATIKKGLATPGQLLEGMIRYNAKESVKNGFAHAPMKWLKEGHWDDGPEPPRPGSSTLDAVRSFRDKPDEPSSH